MCELERKGKKYEMPVCVSCSARMRFSLWRRRWEHRCASILCTHKLNADFDLFLNFASFVRFYQFFIFFSLRCAMKRQSDRLNGKNFEFAMAYWWWWRQKNDGPTLGGNAETRCDAIGRNIQKLCSAFKFFQSNAMFYAYATLSVNRKITTFECKTNVPYIVRNYRETEYIQTSDATSIHYYYTRAYRCTMRTYMGIVCIVTTISALYTQH